MSDLKHPPRPWRVGRTVGRTIYDANGELIGMMDTREAALLACVAVNFHHLVTLHQKYAPLEPCVSVLATDMAHAQQLALRKTG